MAVKNLRADAVKEVQVFDKKSDQAEFTGIDDGKTKKTINLKLKEDKKKGYFGKISLAGGLLKNIDNRYNNNLLYGSFKGKRKLSAFLLQGNTGQDGLNWQDAQKYGGGDDNMTMEMDEDGGFMYSWRGGGIDDEPYVNTENGFIKNINAGLQYSNKWKDDKHSLNFAPKFNLQDYNNYKTNFTQTFLGDSILNDNSNTISHVKRYNVRTSTVYDLKLDSANSLKLTVKANFYHTESEETVNTTTTGKTGTLKNTQLRETSLNSDKQAINASLVLKHKFKKNRRTLSVNTDWNLLKTDATSYLNSDNVTFLNGFPIDLQVKQMSDGNKTTQRFVAKAVYTEPLSKKWSMEISHEVSVNAGNNNQAIYAYSPTSGKYDDQVDSLTNDFKQTIIQNRPGLKFNYAFKKLKVNIGSGFGFTSFDLLDRTTKLDYVRHYINYFPTANLTYSYKSNHSLKFYYNGSTQQPNINQLQPLRNNNDQFNQYIGNPLLKPSFAQNFSLSHQSYNFKKDRWTYASLNATVTSNSITNSRIVDASTGKTTTQPVNTNGNLSMFTWSGMGFRNKKTNIRGMIALNGNYTRFADIINNQTSFSNTLGVGLNINLQKAKDKKYDFSLNNDINQNFNKNAQSASTNKFYTLGVNANATVYYK
ncbi:MAG TPA: outer membrane beta-barrel protein, partial [Ferruginibacter sp.]|nr:outer membrane beta-barrel protein [Ferruginibacter sp.]